jgi:hypothetical protein
MVVLNLSDKIDKFKLPAYSYSFKFKVSSAVTKSDSKTILGYGVNSKNSAITQDNLTIYTDTNGLNIKYSSGGNLILELEIPYTSDAFNHVVLVNDASGHQIYTDGVLTTPTYTTGDFTTNVDVALFTDLAIGGEVGEIDGRTDVLVDEYRNPFHGWLSDISFWNRKLNDTEALQLYEDNYGYCVYIMAGQSNMASRLDNKAEAEDNDLTKQKSRVYAYDADTYLSNNTPYSATYHEPSLVTTSNLPFLGAVTYSTHDNVSLWKMFADDLITYTTLPFRKRVLFLPVAYCGTGFDNDVWRELSQLGVANVVNASNIFLNPSNANTNAFDVLSGFLWNQGETDILGKNITYKTDFLNMIDIYDTNITQFNKLTTPIIVAEIAGNYYDSVNYTVGKNLNMKDYINSKFI